MAEDNPRFVQYPGTEIKDPEPPPYRIQLKGRLTIRYTGSGADLLGRYLLWALLTTVTLGIYAPWAANNFCRYVIEHIEAEVEE